MILMKDLIQELRDYLENPVLEIVPGPDDPDTSERFIKLTRTGGVGLDLDDLFDRVDIAVEVAGAQGDYDDAESLAFEVDRFFLRHEMGRMSGARLLSFTRGGGPSALRVDDAQRHHFVCSYTAHVQSALTA